MTTRAIRRYTDEPVYRRRARPASRAAQQAPSGGNVQPQQYVVRHRRRGSRQRRRTGTGGRSTATRRRCPSRLRSATRLRRASWRRTRDASRHLADHVAEAPAIVLFLQPMIPWAPRDEDGPMDIGRLDASVYPAVQNFCVAARVARPGHGAHDRDPDPRRRGCWPSSASRGPVRDRRARARRPPGRPLRRGPAQAGRGGDPLGPLGRPRRYWPDPRQ